MLEWGLLKIHRLGTLRQCLSRSEDLRVVDHLAANECQDGFSFRQV